MEVDRTLAALPEEVVDHYLAILGLLRRNPSLDALRELLAAHLTKVPFENISKLYYRKRLGLVDLPDIRLYLEGIEKYHFGGTCYSNNYHFHLLLQPGIRNEIVCCGHADSGGSRAEHDHH